MDASILNTIKKLLGLDISYTPFDTDIIVFINSAMMVLQQLGVGPLEGFTITGPKETWADFLPSDTMLDGAKQYIYLSVKMVFDPPASSTILDAYQKLKSEIEWRLREQAEFYPGDGSRPGYYEKAEEVDPDDTSQWNEIDTMDVISGFRVHGGRYESDPDFPWKDGPVQPAIEDGD